MPYTRQRQRQRLTYGTDNLAKQSPNIRRAVRGIRHRMQGGGWQTDASEAGPHPVKQENDAKKKDAINIQMHVKAVIFSVCSRCAAG